jgi:palmitoyltransferase
MDHHCPWIMNWFVTLNLTPQRWIQKLQVLLFVRYIYLGVLSRCILLHDALFDNNHLKRYIGTYTKRLIAQKPEELYFGILLSFVLSIVFLIVLTIFLATHTYYILQNKTTIESLEQRPRYRNEDRFVSREQNIYDLGIQSNWEQIFGTRPLLWFIPVFTRYSIACNLC